MFTKTFPIMEKLCQADYILLFEINLLFLELTCLILLTLKCPTADVYLEEPSDLRNITKSSSFESWFRIFYLDFQNSNKLA